MSGRAARLKGQVKTGGTAVSGNHLNMSEKIFKGGLVPDYLLGLKGLGSGGAWSAVAHETQQLRQIDNLVNDSVSDELVFHVKDKDGKPRTTAFPLFGKTMRPDDEGNVRITDSGKLALSAQLKAFRTAETKKLMEHVRCGDDIACYIFGVHPDIWTTWCAEKGYPPGCKMDPKLSDLKCTVEYIDSLPPSLTQTQSVAKLYKIVEFLGKNVNIEALSNLGDIASNMKDGHNNPTYLGEEGPFAEENSDAQKAQRAANLAAEKTLRGM
jgi:hypothetical protein